MRHVLLLSCAVALQASGYAHGQAATPTLASQWGWGIRAGLGSQSSGYHTGTGRDETQRNTTATAGLLATRYFAGARIGLGLEALAGCQPVEVTYRRAAALPSYQPQTLNQWTLFTPLYLRTGTPASRLHLLVGGGPTFRPGQRDTEAAYYPRVAELTLLLGAELRLPAFHRYETTLGLRLQTALTPSYAYGYPSFYTSQGVDVGSESRHDVRTTWVGFMLGTTLYPAASR